MENQGKTKAQMKASYIGASVGFVGMLIVFIYAMFS